MFWQNTFGSFVFLSVVQELHKLFWSFFLCWYYWNIRLLWKRDYRLNNFSTFYLSESERFDETRETVNVSSIFCLQFFKKCVAWTLSTSLVFLKIQCGFICIFRERQNVELCYARSIWACRRPIFIKFYFLTYCCRNRIFRNSVLLQTHSPHSPQQFQPTKKHTHTRWKHPSFVVVVFLFVSWNWILFFIIIFTTSSINTKLRSLVNNSYDHSLCMCSIVRVDFIW